MKRPLVVILPFVLALACTSCTLLPFLSPRTSTTPGQQSETPTAAPVPPSSSDAPPTATGTSVATGRSDCVKIPASSAGDTCVFDYNEFQKDKLVYGQYSINQLVQRFGAPVKAYGYSAEIFGAGVSMEYPGFTLSMYALDGTLSFDGAGGGPDEEFPLTAQDKTLPMNIISQQVTDPAFPLSRGLKIGTSTRQDVLAAYPPDGGAYVDDSVLVYNYIWFDEFDQYKDGNALIPSLAYRFGSDGILASVSFGWIVID